MVISLKDKRIFPRIRLKTPLKLQLRGVPEYSNAITDNISLGGIGFVNHGFIAPNTPLALEINVLSRVLNPSGRVAWSCPVQHSDRYRVGVEFSGFNPIEKDYLSDYIDMQTNRL